MKNLTQYLQKQEDNLVAATANLLNLLNVNVTTSLCKDKILSNPNYPSLLSVTETLKEWKVDAEAFTVTPDKLQLLPVPFIAHLKPHSGSFVAVKSVKNDSITYLQEDWTEKTINLKTFLNQWSKTVLLAEALPESGQTDYTKARWQERLTFMRLPLFMLLFFVAAVTQFVTTVNHLVGRQFFFYTGLWGCITLGAFITSLLMWYEYDNNNVYLKKICSISKKTDCNAVLSSSASRLLGVSWSEIGFFYFIGSFIYLILCNYSSASLSPLIMLNILTLPYILFSVYYQAFIVKQWCVLCLAVQAILLGEFLVGLYGGQVGVSFISGWQHTPYAKLLFSFLSPVLLWLIIKPYVYGAKDNEELRYSFLRFKNNPEVFNSLLQRQTPVKSNPEGLGITLGNPDAENTLIKICNPYCGPCAKSFPHLEDLLNSGSGKWKVQIIFTASANENDHRALPVAHFLQIAEEGSDSNTVQKALADWYNEKNKNYEAYIKKYPITVKFECQKGKLAAMDEWCKNEEIRFTPTYYVNGRRLPEAYSIEDLKNIA